MTVRTRAYFAALAALTQAEMADLYESALFAEDIDVDPALTADSDAKVPSQKAVKEFVETYAAPDGATKVNTDIIAVGPFTRAAIAAGVSGQAHVFAGAAGNQVTLPAAATLVGISAWFAGAHSAGVMTIRARKNGSPDSTLQAASGAADTKWSNTGTGVAYAAGDSASVESDTDVSWDGTSGILVAYLWFRLAKI